VFVVRLHHLFAALIALCVCVESHVMVTLPYTRPPLPLGTCHIAFGACLLHTSHCILIVFAFSLLHSARGRWNSVRRLLVGALDAVIDDDEDSSDDESDGGGGGDDDDDARCSGGAGDDDSGARRRPRGRPFVRMQRDAPPAAVVDAVRALDGAGFSFLLVCSTCFSSLSTLSLPSLSPRCILIDPLCDCVI